MYSYLMCILCYGVCVMLPAYKQSASAWKIWCTYKMSVCTRTRITSHSYTDTHTRQKYVRVSVVFNKCAVCLRTCVFCRLTTQKDESFRSIMHSIRMPRYRQHTSNAMPHPRRAATVPLRRVCMPKNTHTHAAINKWPRARAWDNKSLDTDARFRAQR